MEVLVRTVDDLLKDYGYPLLGLDEKEYEVLIWPTTKRCPGIIVKGWEGRAYRNWIKMAEDFEDKKEGDEKGWGGRQHTQKVLDYVRKLERQPKQFDWDTLQRRLAFSRIIGSGVDKDDGVLQRVMKELSDYDVMGRVGGEIYARQHKTLKVPSGWKLMRFRELRKKYGDETLKHHYQPPFLGPSFSTTLDVLASGSLQGIIFRDESVSSQIAEKKVCYINEAGRGVQWGWCFTPPATTETELDRYHRELEEAEKEARKIKEGQVEAWLAKRVNLPVAGRIQECFIKPAFFEAMIDEIGKDGEEDINLSDLKGKMLAKERDEGGDYNILDIMVKQSGLKTPFKKKLYARLHYELEYPLSEEQAKKIKVTPWPKDEEEVAQAQVVIETLVHMLEKGATIEGIREEKNRDIRRYMVMDKVLEMQNARHDLDEWLRRIKEGGLEMEPVFPPFEPEPEPEPEPAPEVAMTLSSESDDAEPHPTSSDEELRGVAVPDIAGLGKRKSKKRKYKKRKSKKRKSKKKRSKKKSKKRKSKKKRQ